MSSSSESEKDCCGKSYSVTVAVVVVCLIFAALVWKTRQYTTPAPLGAERAAERATEPDAWRASEPRDLLVLNDSRVIPARLIGRKASGGRIEVLLVEPLSGSAPGSPARCVL